MGALDPIAGFGVTFISRAAIEADLVAGTLASARVKGLEPARVHGPRQHAVALRLLQDHPVLLVGPFEERRVGHAIGWLDAAHPHVGRAHAGCNDPGSALTPACTTSGGSRAAASWTSAG